MKRAFRFFGAILVAAILLVGLWGTGCKKASPEEELNAAIDQAITALGTRDYKAFINRWPAPEDKKQLLEGTTIEKRAEQFAAGPANKMIEHLRAARGKAPTWNAEHTRATFSVGEMEPDFVLERIDGRWYIRN